MEQEKNAVPSPEDKQSSEVLENEDHLPTRRSLLRQGLEAAAVAAAAVIGGDSALAQTQRKPQPLILRDDELAAKTQALYKELKSSPRLQSEFINTPSQVVAQRFLPANVAAGISPQRLNNANRVLFSIIANDGFRAWAQEYQININKTGKTDKSQIIKDFSAAVIRYGDAALVQGVMEEDGLRRAQSSPSDGLLVAADAVVVLWAFVFVAFAAILVLGYQGGGPAQTLTATEFRGIIDKMTSKARDMGRSGALTESFIR